MSFVGKILVVIQVVLSVVFMAFAGAVYTAHMNWRDTANKLKGDLTKAENEKTTLRGQMDTLNNTLTAKLTTAEQLASEREAKVKGLQQEVNRLQTDTGDLQIARKTAIDQAKIATEESQARKLESLGLRKQNHELTGKRDSEFAERVKLEDTIRTLQIELETATGKNKDLLGKVAVLQQALEAAGLSSDVTQLATKNSPPPPVEGEIREILPAKRQGSTELVEVSLGSDDGLKPGHEMTVYRSGLKGNQRSKYLARIKIVKSTPDKAVGQVIESSRNGLIQKGDYVTTKF